MNRSTSYPPKVTLAHLPTPIEPLLFHDATFPQKLFLKRDDLTGTEMSGNKVRKLEFAIGEALAKGCDTLITCGGIQSNHCRATAAAAAKLGLSCILLLRTDERQAIDGNHLMDLLLGAEVRFVTTSEYQEERSQKMQDIVQELAAQGKKGYVIPEGASNGIGTFGYYEAMQEIAAQEEMLGVLFDTVVCTIGSGGTYAGLCLGNKIHGMNKMIVGFNICNDAAHFQKEILQISNEFGAIWGTETLLLPEDIHIIDGSPGRGYALNTPQELAFLADFAKSHGVLLDPVYTGKAMMGLMHQLQLQSHPWIRQSKNILFIHTGGLLGLFPKRFQFDL